MWEKDKDYTNVFVYYFKHYRIEINVVDNTKNLKYYIYVGSGLKRKDLKTYEQKQTKIKSDFSNLKQLYEIIMSFDDYYISICVKNKKRYFCINWSDSRRKKIYSRILLNKGWRIGYIDNYETLFYKL